MLPLVLAVMLLLVLLYMYNMCSATVTAPVLCVFMSRAAYTAGLLRTLRRQRVKSLLPVVHMCADYSVMLFLFL